MIVLPVSNHLNKRAYKKMYEIKKTYKAIVFDEEKQCFSKRITIEAYDAVDAMSKMNARYGRDKYIDLHNEDDANKPR